MMDKFKIDSQKLVYHPERVSQWLKGENIYPICIEMGPCGRCNHRCIFCAFDYLNYKGPLLNKDVFKRTILDAAQHGVKSIIFSGEGEPLLHPSIVAFINYAKKNSLDVAISTNGVFFDTETAEQCLGSLTWIRFSVDAGTKETYSKIHRCPPSDFNKTINNIEAAVRVKNKYDYDCAIGIQSLLLPENYNEMRMLTSLSKELGVDYMTIKPLSKHPFSAHNTDFNYKQHLDLENELQKFTTDNFEVIFRAHAMEKLEREKPYKQCLGLPFLTQIDSSGNIYTCNAFLGIEDYCYGNIREKSFSEIWESEQKKRVLDKIAKLDVSKCREVCRLDEINRYLWDLKYESVSHVSFI